MSLTLHSLVWLMDATESPGRTILSIVVAILVVAALIGLYTEMKGPR